MDEITEIFFQLLKKAESNKLNWTPSLNSFLQFFIGSVGNLNTGMSEVPENPEKVLKHLIEYEKKRDKVFDNKDLRASLEKIFGHKRLKQEIPESKLDKKKDVEHPVRFDWRDVHGKNYVSRVKLQGFCNSCASFGVISTIETTARFEKKIHVTAKNETSVLDLSEQQLFFTNDSYPEKCSCEKGWFIEDALDFSLDVGIVPEAIYNYNPFNPFFKPPIANLPKGWQKKVTKISGYTAYTDNERMKHHLSTKGPLVASIDMYYDFLFYSKGVYSHFIDDLIGGHCVSCIGYDDDKGAWLCKNSWGEQWGEGGYFWVKYGDSKIDDEMWGIDGFSEIYLPDK